MRNSIGSSPKEFILLVSTTDYNVVLARNGNRWQQLLVMITSSNTEIADEPRKVISVYTMAAAPNNNQLASALLISKGVQGRLLPLPTIADHNQAKSL